MAVDKPRILEQLRQVRPPGRTEDIVSLAMVRNLSVCEDYVRVALAVGDDAPDAREQLRLDVETAIRDLDPEMKQVNVVFVEPGGDGSADDSAGGGQAQGRSDAPQAGAASEQQQQSPQAQARESNPLPNVRHVIAVGAGKGGVGKSTVAVNLAVGLARAGHTVGLLDGDIYGPSTPTLLGLHDRQVTGTSQMLHPLFVHGIKTITIGKLVDPEKALIWRGPMAHGAFRQLALQTEWGELDELIVDLPPGTGDVPLTLAQMLPLSGAVIVCTPQRVAQDDAVRAVRMFEGLDIPVLGVIENMSYFIGDDGKEYDIFGRGGAKEMADRMNLPLLGTVPINMALRANGDAGDPRRNFESGDQLAEELMTMCHAVSDAVEQRGGEKDRPTLSIS